MDWKHLLFKIVTIIRSSDNFDFDLFNTSSMRKNNPLDSETFDDDQH